MGRILRPMKRTRSLGALAALSAVIVLVSSCGDSSGPGSGAVSISANSATNLSAAPGSQVAELPSVIVRDKGGQPLSGARVTFSVETGGGTVTGGSTTTDASGIATVGSWTLGPSSGSNTLSARTGSLPAVTFTADAADPCSILQPHSLGTTTDSQLSPRDCQLSDGRFVDFYTVTLPAAGTYVFN